mmetsp:Transcript_31876/g.92308  ORF Transcript_31876/g.92308 Transcript_31876/m.92308 type:complete len:235 (+) Transcript_31876:63-767(+)
MSRDACTVSTFAMTSTRQVAHGLARQPVTSLEACTESACASESQEVPCVVDLPLPCLCGRPPTLQRLDVRRPFGVEDAGVAAITGTLHAEWWLGHDVLEARRVEPVTAERSLRRVSLFLALLDGVDDRLFAVRTLLMRQQPGEFVDDVLDHGIEGGDGLAAISVRLGDARGGRPGGRLRHLRRLLLLPLPLPLVEDLLLAPHLLVIRHARQLTCDFEELDVMLVLADAQLHHLL